MAKYEIPLTAVIDVPTDAAADAAATKVDKLLPMAAGLLVTQGIKIVGKIQVGKPRKI